MPTFKNKSNYLFRNKLKKHFLKHFFLNKLNDSLKNFFQNLLLY